MSSISCKYPLVRRLNLLCEMRSCSFWFNFTLKTDICIAPAKSKKKTFQPGALKSLRSVTLKCLSGTCQMCHPIRFLGDEWLFGGCTVSLQEASQIKRQLWILEVPTLWSLISTVSAKYSLGMYRLNLWDFSLWAVWRQVSPRTVGDGRGWVPEGGG